MYTMREGPSLGGGERGGGCMASNVAINKCVEINKSIKKDICFQRW